MTEKIRVMQMGIGPIGCGVTRVLAHKAGMEIVGAIDLVNVGQDLGEIAELGRKLGVLICDDPDAVLRETKPDIAIHTTSSRFQKVSAELEQLIRAGVNVVSSCEELAYPYETSADLAVQIDKLAKENNTTVLGTGVNPGFVMDAWPLFMTGVCAEVQEVRVRRFVDASTRRIPLQKKIGAGATVEEFGKLVESGTLRHVGLQESVAMIAAGLGWELDDITERIEPIVYETEVKSDYLTVQPGQVAGVKQTGHGWKNGKATITLELEAAIGAAESYDGVYITGTPNMEVIIKGGIHGDIAAVAMLTNAVPKVIDAPPGLKTMRDLIISAVPNR